MSGFATYGEGWHVENLDENLDESEMSRYQYPIFAIWRGRRFCGVAGGLDGVNNLIEETARSAVKDADTQLGAVQVKLFARVLTRRVVKTFHVHVRLRWFEGEVNTPKAWIVDQVTKVRVADEKVRITDRKVRVANGKGRSR